ncbi:hypothetical protein LXL04_002341 [Taraxacum kok-saghyz]
MSKLRWMKTFNSSKFLIDTNILKIKKHTPVYEIRYLIICGKCILTHNYNRPNWIAKLSEKLLNCILRPEFVKSGGYIHQIEIQGAHRACTWTGGIIWYQIRAEMSPETAAHPSIVEVGVIRTPKKTGPTLSNNLKDLTSEDKLPNSTNTHDGENVILASHIRVFESDHIRLTFGSLGMEDSSQTFGFQDVEESHQHTYIEVDESLFSSSSVSSDESCGGSQIESVDEHVPSSSSSFRTTIKRNTGVFKSRKHGKLY